MCCLVIGGEFRQSIFSTANWRSRFSSGSPCYALISLFPGLTYAADLCVSAGVHSNPSPVITVYSRHILQEALLQTRRHIRVTLAEICADQQNDCNYM